MGVSFRSNHQIALDQLNYLSYNLTNKICLISSTLSPLVHLQFLIKSIQCENNGNRFVSHWCAWCIVGGRMGWGTRTGGGGSRGRE